VGCGVRVGRVAEPEGGVGVLATLYNVSQADSAEANLLMTMEELGAAQTDIAPVRAAAIRLAGQVREWEALPRRTPRRRSPVTETLGGGLD
jgi:hypothetical protein